MIWSRYLRNEQYLVGLSCSNGESIAHIISPYTFEQALYYFVVKCFSLGFSIPYVIFLTRGEMRCENLLKSRFSRLSYSPRYSVDKKSDNMLKRELFRYIKMGTSQDRLKDQARLCSQYII